MTEASANLSAELERLDLLLQREILRLRATYQLSLDEFRGLYVSDEQVNQLIDRALNHGGATPATEDLTRRAEAMRLASEAARCNHLPWARLIAEFSLSSTEQDILLFAVAPEFDLKYETLFAYLNNDVTRKWPTRDLALRLFSTTAEERTAVRSCLTADSVLFSSGLLQLISSTPERPSWLASGFSVAPSVSDYLSGSSFCDSRLSSFVELRDSGAGWDRVLIPSAQRATLRQRLIRSAQNQGALLTVLTGRSGAGRNLAAESLCHELGIALLCVDLAGLRSSGEDVGKATQVILLQQRLLRSGLYLAHGESLFDREGPPVPDAQRIIKLLTQAKGPVFLACETGTRWRELMLGQRAACFHFDDPDYTQRLQLWENALAENKLCVIGAELEALADRFVLNLGQITAATVAAADAASLTAELTGKIPGATEDSISLDAASLFAAARAQSDQSLGNLAVKVRTIHDWEALILPRVTLQRVKEVAAAIKHRHVVYSEWGFAQRIESGQGLKALFAGASGTGKTMTAGVIAKELGLDLYKIDLSAIVSKYIGETEKNLDRIFRAAQSSNAILFFDEADALFGKRSEVKDAHDRYANIEVAYLLQKIEEYEGVVILASNLSKNIDDAFARRMHYVVEFPLPDENHREQLWRGMFPPQVPLDEHVDFKFIAKQFSITGGDIRNVALDAAFLAAQDGQVVTMKQLIQALARQMMKQGRIPSPTDFKQYHSLIEQER